MNFTQDFENLFREGLSEAELGNIFMSINSSSVRQTRSPLSLSHFEITDSGLTVEIIDNRHHTRLSIPRTEYGTIRPPILHNHDYFELMFVLRGKLKIQIEETVYTYQAGDACLFDRNIHHAELERQGYIYTVKGRGSFVAENGKMKDNRKKELLIQVSEMIDEAIRLGISGEELKNMVEIQYEAAGKTGGGRQ